MPQIQLIVGVQDFPVVSQRQLPTVLSFLSRCSSWRLSTCPLLCNDRCAQLQFVDKVVNIPVVSQRRIPKVPSVQSTITIPLLQHVDKVVYVLVEQVAQVLRCRLPHVCGESAHEQMAIQMVLALVQQHSHGVLRNQRTATRTGGEAREVLHGQVPGAPLPQRSRPAPLPEVAGWQERVERHVVEDLGELAPLVQILDALVPQPVDIVTVTLRILDFPIAEQVVSAQDLLLSMSISFSCS